MSITKKQRKEVYNKSDGHCWYCGCDLPDKWHVDHVEPVIRNYGGKIDPAMSHLDTVDNMVPACPPCNMFKGTSSIERFRKHIERLPDILDTYSVKYRNAIRFNMLQDMREPATFWFEEEGNIS